ncbi:MAG TPA: HipA domain-containing protein, partial [Homoserinimonas sp.]|nr:HipA domain-containing protein [Homoserinimonas sp.]
TIERAGQTTFLSIERFDRIVAGRDIRLLHQEDFAQALGLDWRDTETKFQDADWPANPNRPSATRVAELTGSLPDSTTVTTEWLRQLVFHVLIGNNDGHAKNVALVHDHGGTRLAELYDAIPNFHQPGRISWDMALAIDGIFDHRQVSTEHLVNEALSWSVLRRATVETVIAETIRAFTAAQVAVTPPAGIEAGVAERLAWNASRLAAGAEISKPKEK